MDQHILHVKNLSVSFNKNKNKMTAVSDVSLQIDKGQTVALIGESGSGKSITSLSVLQLLPPNGQLEKGSITFKGKDLLKQSEKEMRRIRGNEISMIFQDAIASLNPGMKVGVQITEGLKYHKLVPKSDLKAEALQLLEQVGFKNPAHIYEQYPVQLSGGMKQRILIAMAISCKPQLIIADEPTTSLDVTIQRQVLDLIDNYKSDLDASVLLITHDFGVVAEYADWVYVMLGGHIVESADVYTIFKNPVHPYTKALIESIPNPEKSQERLKSIQDFTFEKVGYKGRTFAPETYTLESKSFNAPSSLVEVEPLHYVRFYDDERKVVSIG
ncbi:ABC transporter ATP-binding protein [Fictibacillus barbaricus]|uniref:ABC transporter ATP-binding protein n=1 Tax=Fictibacillus barbaricus TaxID=182136 RepID=A0ABS2Z8E6_9BACL|nr:ABC transporter ATP-binding protein [Fictibacillus barbaricus]MBN3544405.1 ABC transporter ATP-binding protein [Fictibacillus barbaricus]GGB67104.1 ABC transporter ATP-binding protein [Fictibacillus barbaricus]